MKKTSVRVVATVTLVMLGVMLFLAAAPVQAQNVENDVLPSALDLGSGSAYSGGLPGTASDVTFLLGTSYDNAASLTVSTAAISIGTLNDLNATPLTIAGLSTGTAQTITLNGGSNGVAAANGGAATDLIYVSSVGNLSINAGGSQPLGLVLASNGNFDVASGGALAIGSTISGAGNVTKTGEGLLTLSGANTFAGGLTVSSGTVSLGSVSALTVNNSLAIQSGGILDLNGNSNTVYSLSGSGVLTSGSGAATLTLGGAGDYTYAGTITGPVGLTVSLTSGSLILANANTHTGGTVLVGSGTLKLAHANALQSSTLTVTGSSPTLLFDHSAGPAFNVGALAAADPSLNIGLQDTADSPIVLHVGGNGVSTDYLGNFSGSGSLVKDGAGGLRLTGSNTYTGGTVLNNGSLYICSANALGTGPLVINGGQISNSNPGHTATVTLATNNPVTINNSFWYAATGFPLDLGSGTVTLANANITIGVSGNNTGLTMGTLVNTTTGAQTLTIAPDSSATQSNTFNFGGYVLTNSPGSSVTNTIAGGKIVRFGGPITDGAGTNCGIVFSVAGTVSLRAACTYTGPTTISAGTTLELGTGATGLDGSINFTSGVTNNSVLSYKLFGAATANYVISGTGAVSKAGAGTLTLGATNSYSGGTTLSAGVLNVTNAASLGTGPLTITGGSLDNTSGAALTLPNAQNWNGSFTFVGSNNLDLRATTVTLGANATVTIAAGALTVGAIGDGDSDYVLTKAGVGTLTLAGSNNLSGGVTVSNGFLNISNANALGTGTFSISGGTFDNTSGGTLTLQTNNPVKLSNNAAFGGSNNLDLGTGTFTVTANSKILTLSGAGTTLTVAKLVNGYSSALTFTVDGAGNTLASGGFDLSSSGTTAITNTLKGSGNVTINGPVTDGTVSGCGLTYNGTGTLTLSGNNTYSGRTTLTAGQLNINAQGTDSSNSAIGTGPLTITAGTIDATNGPIDLSGTTNNAITLGGNFTFGGANNLNFGTGAITNAGSRTITLGGIGSTLTLGGVMTNTANAVQTTTVNGPGNTLVLGGYALSNNATSRIDVIAGTANVTITGPVTNGGTATASGLTYSGTGTLTLSGTNTYAGATAVKTGTLVVGTNAPSGSDGAFGNATSEVSFGVAGGNSDASILIGGAFDVGRNIRFLTNATADTGTRVLTLGGNTADNSTFSGNIILGSTNNAGRGVTLTAAGGGQVTFSGAIQNPTGMDATTYTVTKTGLGTVVLSGSNTYTGETSVQNGVLTYLNTTAKPASGTTTVAAAATLGLGVGFGAPYFVAGDVDSLFAGTLTNVTNDANSYVGIDTTAGDFDYTSSVSSTRGLNKLGPYTLTLSGNNTYTGNTYVTAGTLKLAPNSGSALTENSAVQNDAAFEIAAPAQEVGAISGSGNTSVIGGASLTADSIMQNTLTINANSTVTIASSGTSVVNFLQISDGTDFTWGSGSSGAVPAGTNDAGSAGAPSGSAVPEPATWLLIVMAALAGLVAWRRR